MPSAGALRCKGVGGMGWAEEPGWVPGAEERAGGHGN